MPAPIPIDPFKSMSAYFAYELRRLREERGLSQDQLAKELYSTRASIEAYESQRNRPDEEFAKQLDEYFGTGLHFQALWHHARREHLKQWKEASLSYEREAVDIRYFQPMAIPGLFQTEGYMRARVGKVDALEELIAARLARSAILTVEHPPYLWVLIDEGAIRRPVGGPEIMAEQLQVLLDMGELPNVTIQIIPESTGGYLGMDGGLVIYMNAERRSIGYVEAQFGGRLIEEPGEVRDLEIRYGQITAKALSDVGSRALIQKTLESFRGHPLAEEQPE